MRAGFAKVSITPPLGTCMMGFGSRDRAHGCTAIHDPIFVRATWLEHAGAEALLLSFDLCFLGREEADRYKGAVGRRFDILPSHILMNASHSHSGPAVGPWYYGDFRAPDTLYLQDLEDALLKAAETARATARPARLRAGRARSAVPMNRRRKENGQVLLAPDPGGTVCDALPMCLIEDTAGEPVSLLFSVSCHPATLANWEVSAEFPGVAMDRLDAHFGGAVSQFLQGAGGDAMPGAMHAGEPRWGTGTWEMAEKTGNQVADEVLGGLETGLMEAEPHIRCASVEMHWPLQDAPARRHFEAMAAEGETDWRRLWAKRQVQRLDRGETLATHAQLTAQGMQLGAGLRMIALEGEPVAAHGLAILDAFAEGVTFPLGYSNGTGLYLVTSEMVDEGGMEVASYGEYRYPAPLAPGMEKELAAALANLRARGIA